MGLNAQRPTYVMSKALWQHAGILTGSAQPGQRSPLEVKQILKIRTDVWMDGKMDAFKYLRILDA